MPRKPLTAAEAALYATLAYVAKLNLQKQAISRGNYRIDLRLVGTVAGHSIDISINGEGQQSGMQTTASTTGPSKEDLWAYARQHIPATRIAQVEADAIAMFADEGRLPGVADVDIAAAKTWLKKCRASESVTKAGAWTFAADPDPEDLQSAISREAA